jgi:putative aldouronate transport system substrate-binding protein
MTKEIADLLYWGIEGTHHVVENGRAKMIADAATWDRDVKPYQALEIGEPETNGRYEGLHTYEPLAKAEELYKLNEERLINDPTAALDSPTYNEKGLQLQSIMTDATYQYMLGEIDLAGFEKAIEQWKAQGGAKMIEEFTAAYNALK